MDVTPVPVDALGADELLRWERLQRAMPMFASPFFRPEFTRAVAAVRRGVEVAVLRQGGRVVGFFPFERGTGDMGRPVGGRLSDYHGAIVDGGAHWDGAGLVRGSRLRAWTFTHLPAAQGPLAAFATAHDASPYLDLSGGYAAYEQGRRAAKSDVLSQVRRARRRLEDVHGPATFSGDDTSPAALHQLLALKSAQYARTGQVDIFAARWIVALFERILAERGPAFVGTLSTLRVGDRLVAAHFGMRTTDVWHYWIPAYDPEFARFKPGLILLLEMARHAASAGIGVLDLGRGDEHYKGRLASDTFPLAEGVVTDSRLVAARQALRGRANAAAARSRFVATGLRAVRSLRLRADDVRGRRR